MDRGDQGIGAKSKVSRSSFVACKDLKLMSCLSLTVVGQFVQA